MDGLVGRTGALPSKAKAMTTEKSTLQKALEAKPRQTFDFDLTQHLGLAGVTPKVRVRVATKFEQDRALVAAHNYVKEIASQNDKAASDPDILEDAKSAAIAFECCRDADSPKDMPAFNSPKDMMRTLTSDEIAVLVNLCNEVRAKVSPAPKDISRDTMESLIKMCVDHVGDDIPEAVFANFGREYLTHMVVLLCCELTEARAKLAPTPEPEPVPQVAA